ncbi:hypothetical protein K439DRAFT_1378318, partial [Ramaria rubella]
VKEWTGQMFTHHDLSELGLVISLGNHGAIYHHVPTGVEPTCMTVVHTMGIHWNRIHWCHCSPLVPPLHQLLHVGLFPATVEDKFRIPTSFTFGVLREFHIESLSSKISAYDYYDSLCRHINNAFPATVPVSHCTACCSNSLLMIYRTSIMTY